MMLDTGEIVLSARQCERLREALEAHAAKLQESVVKTGLPKANTLQETIESGAEMYEGLRKAGDIEPALAMTLIVAPFVMRHAITQMVLTQEQDELIDALFQASSSILLRPIHKMAKDDLEIAQAVGFAD